ncbi:MAG: DUF2306 domain-containing protein [Pseudomonadota bacterium]
MKIEDLRYKNLVWMIAVLMTIGFTLGISKYFFLDYSKLGPRVPEYKDTFGFIFLHVIFGATWVIAGVAAMAFTGFRKPKLHKRIGYFVAFSCIVSCVTVTAMTLILKERALLGITIVGIQRSVLSLAFLTLAIYHVKKKSFARHRAWTLRLFGLSFNIVSLRVGVYYFSDYLDPRIIQYGVFAILFTVIELVISGRLDGRVGRAWRYPALAGAGTIGVLIGFFIFSVMEAR